MNRGGNEYIKKDNHDCILVYAILSKGFKVIENTIHPYLNIIALFFHDLMGILTNYILTRHEIERFSFHENSFPVVREFPHYLSYGDVTREIRHENKIFKKQHVGGLQSRIASYVAVFIERFISKEYIRIGISSGISLDADFKCKVFLDAPTISVPCFNRQMSILYDCIDEIWETTKLNVSSERMKKLVENHIHIYIKDQRSRTTQGVDVFITRFPAKISQRIISALCKTNKATVINILHGEGHGIIDEPIVGYGDKGFADVMLGYGDYGQKIWPQFEYAKPLFKEPQYIPSSSDVIKSIYRSSRVEPLKALENKKIMYVPTAFSGLRYRYGPFRDMPDVMYLQWQEQLIKHFPDLIWKGHCKERVRPDLVPSNARYITRERFEQCLNDVDIFFFDYVASAFFIACATEKPVIFFDIGLRNISVEGYESIKKRCIVIDVNVDSVGDLRERVAAQLKITLDNELTCRFSLSDNRDQSRYEILEEWISKDMVVTS